MDKHGIERKNDLADYFGGAAWILCDEMKGKGPMWCYAPLLSIKPLVDMAPNANYSVLDFSSPTFYEDMKEILR